jgi:heptosyltransferase III
MPQPTPKKILAIQFKYLGDAVFITPALFALKEQFPNSEIHVLVAKEVAPLLKNIKWITKVWAMPRTRGKFNLFETWPFIQQLRNEQFERSVDFGGNDRAAIFSFLIGAKIRLAPRESPTKLFYKIAYTQMINVDQLPIPWVERHLKLLSLAWNTPIKSKAKIEIICDSALAVVAKKAISSKTVLCHIGTSQEKKEWAVTKWFEFYTLASQRGYQLIFSAGNNQREQALISKLKSLAPNIVTLDPRNDLDMFLAILKQAEVVIAGDTGPLHFAAGLGVKVIGLFGAENSILQAAPNYESHQKVIANSCTCTGPLANYPSCKSKRACMESIKTTDVLELLLSIYPLTQ